MHISTGENYLNISHRKTGTVFTFPVIFIS